VCGVDARNGLLTAADRIQKSLPVVDALVAHPVARLSLDGRHVVKFHFVGRQQPDVPGLRTEPKQIARRLDLVASIDLHPALLTDETGAQRLLLVVREHHAQAVRIGKDGLPALDVIGISFVDVVGGFGDLHLERLGGEGRTAPLRDVQMMHAPVRGPSLTVVVDEVEVWILDAAVVVGVPARGAEPHLPVHVGGNRLGLVRSFELGLKAGALDGDADFGDLAQVAVAGEFRALAEVAEGALPQAGLEDAVILADDCAHGDAVVDADSGGLLAPDVLACAGGRNRDERMPVVLRSAHHRVDLLAGEEVSEIRILGTPLVAVFAVDFILGAPHTAVPRVADRHDAAVAAGHEVARIQHAAVAGADDAERDPLVRAESGRRNDRGNPHGRHSDR